MRAILIILSILIILVLLFYLIVRHSESDKKGPPYSGYSKSIEESKWRGTFEFEVTPINNTFVFDSNHKLKIRTAWLEYGWTSQAYLLGKGTLERNGQHQLLLVLDTAQNNKTSTDNIYYFIGGRPHGDTLVHYYYYRNDTIKVPLYRERTSKLPSSDIRKAYDSLTFVKK